jgi:hypothetical protein
VTSYSRSEELGRGPLRRSQDQGEEAQERQEVAVELMREDGGREEPKEQGAKQRQPDETKISNGIQHPEASDYSYDTSDEDNEDPRPAKRRRLPSTETTLILPDEPAPVANDDYILREPLGAPPLRWSRHYSRSTRSSPSKAS